jgi:iron complex outermembrane recepter protein
MHKLFLIVAFCVAGFSAKTQDCNLTLSGHVVDEDVKEHLDNATIFIKELNKTITTDANGDFAFSLLCAGTYSLKVTHISCTPYEKKISLIKSTHLDIYMPHAKSTLGDAIVTAQKERQNTGFKKELSGIALNETRGTNLAEALQKLNGVTLLQTGSTVSKPVVHGLFGSRLLLINNGVRQEGQQWGNEHAPEVDPFIADKISVIKGVDELKYGSDAIGGVILVEPKLMRSKAGKTLDVHTGYFSNNKLFYVNGIYEFMPKNNNHLSFRVQGTYRRGANSATPDYRLNNTGIQEYNFSTAMRYKKGIKTLDLFASSFHTTLGIFTGSHIGNITDLKNAINSTQPNAVFLGQNTYTINRPRQEVQHQLCKAKSSWNYSKHKLQVQVTAQRNQRQEFDVVRNATSTTPQLDLTVSTFAQDVSWETIKPKAGSSTLGISGVQQVNTYTGRYFIPNYTATSFGLYAIQKWSMQHWQLQAGLRGDWKSIQTTRLKFNGDIISYPFSFKTVAASANAGYSMHSNFKTNFNIAISSRAPYVNELLSDGIHHGTATYEKGNIFLKAEKAFFTSWNVQFHTTNQKFSGELLLHNNFINDFIYQQPKPNDPVLTIAGAFPRMDWLQTNAVLTGADFSFEYQLFGKLTWNTKVSILYAKDRKAKDWLILMPANRMTNTLRLDIANYKKYSNNFIGLELLQVVQQKRIPSDSLKSDFKNPPKGYALVQLSMGTTISLHKLPLTILLSCNNLLNTAYRDYQNTFRYFTDETGRNISLKLKIPIIL